VKLGSLLKAAGSSCVMAKGVHPTLPGVVSFANDKQPILTSN
jgi:hypothetical protein